MNTANIFAEQAPRLIALGYSPIPLLTNDKRPVVPNWQQWCERRMTPAEMSGHGGNIGLACGRFTTAIDMDDEAAFRLIGPALLTYGTVGKFGRDGRTDIFQTNPNAVETPRKWKSKRDQDGNRRNLIEILGHGNQTVLPPSIHPHTQQPYVWTGAPLWDVPLDRLPMVPPGLGAWIEATLLEAGMIDDPAAQAAYRVATLSAAPELAAEVRARWSVYQEYSVAFLAKKANALARLTNGRHLALYSAALSVGPYVGIGLLTDEQVEHAMMWACNQNGFFERTLHVKSQGAAKEFARQVNNGLSKGEGLPPARLKLGIDELLKLMPVQGSAVAVGLSLPAGAVVPVADQAPAPESVDVFYAYLPNRTYYHRPSGAFWPAGSVDDLIPPIKIGTDPAHDAVDKTMKATKWLARNRRIDQKTWFPGMPEIIENCIYADGILMEVAGQRVLNTYKGPTPLQPKGDDVSMWIDHLRFLYPTHAETILDWMAFAAQFPQIKINWALVLGGAQGIGKDSILAPLMRAVGERNWRETTPEIILTSQFNPYLQSRVLRINEAKDTGGESRFQFYDKTKTIITAPPAVHVVNDKNDKNVQIPNLNAVLITTNYRTGGLYLPADDRRHYVTFSDVVRSAFAEGFWARYWTWMNECGRENCAAFLMSRDVSRFNPKAPPAQTPEFWEMVEGGHAVEIHSLRDVVEAMGNEPFQISQLVGKAAELSEIDLRNWLMDNKNALKITRALNDLGISKFKNPEAPKDGRWRTKTGKVTLYKRP